MKAAICGYRANLLNLLQEVIKRSNVNGNSGLLHSRERVVDHHKADA